MKYGHFCGKCGTCPTVGVLRHVGRDPVPLCDKCGRQQEKHDDSKPYTKTPMGVSINAHEWFDRYAGTGYSHRVWA